MVWIAVGILLLGILGFSIFVSSHNLGVDGAYVEDDDLFVELDSTPFVGVSDVEFCVDFADSIVCDGGDDFVESLVFDVSDGEMGDLDFNLSYSDFSGDRWFNGSLQVE